MSLLVKDRQRYADPPTQEVSVVLTHNLYIVNKSSAGMLKGIVQICINTFNKIIK